MPMPVILILDRQAKAGGLKRKSRVLNSPGRARVEPRASDTAIAARWPHGRYVYVRVRAHNPGCAHTVHTANTTSPQQAHEPRQRARGGPLQEHLNPTPDSGYPGFAGNVNREIRDKKRKAGK